MNWPKIILFLLLLPLLGGFGYLFYHKGREVIEIKKRQEYLEAEVEAREKRLAYLIREAETLESDSDKLEGLAREKMGLSHKNEKIFIFEPTPLPAASSPPRSPDKKHPGERFGCSNPDYSRPHSAR